MALERQIVTVPMAQGLDTKTDAAQVAPGKLLALNNGVFTTGKKIRKRYGTTPRAVSILAGGSIASAHTVRAFKDELLVGSGGTLYSWGATAAAWGTKQRFVRAEVSRAPAVRSSVDAYNCGLAVVGTVACYAYMGSVGATDGGFWTLVDTTTGGVIASAYCGLISGIRVTTMGTAFVVMVYDGTTVSYFQVSTAGVQGATVTLATVTLSGSAGLIDCVNNGLSGASERVWFVYPTTTSKVDLYFRSLSNAFALGTATAFGMNLGALTQVLYSVAAGIDSSNGNILVASACSSAVAGTNYLYLSVGTPALAVTVAKVQADSGELVGQVAVANDPTGAVRIWYGFSTAYWSGRVQVATRSVGFAAYTPGAILTIGRNMVPASAPFTVSGVQYIVVAVNYGSNARLVVEAYGFDVSGGRCSALAHIAADDGFATSRIGFNNATPQPPPVAGAAYTSLLLPRPQTISAGTLFPVQITHTTEAANGSFAGTAGFDAVTLSFPATPAVTAEIAGGLVLAGAVPTLYDGAYTSELGYFHTPASLTVSTSAAGGGMTAGDYQYLACYAWQDAAGQVHRSAPSTAASVTTVGATSTNTVAVRSIKLTSKASPYNPVMVELYRTLVTGTVFYKVAETDSSAGTESVTFTDALADSAIEGNAQFYTTGGVLEDVPPPPLSALTVYRNRLVGINAEKPNQVWMSKQVIPGQPVEFSDFLTLNLDPVGGDASALAALDDKLIIFKPDVSFYVTGSGPDATGGQNDLSVPILINTNSGCSEPRSVVTAADGVLYQSRKGWFILDRSLRDAYVGAGVEAYNATTTRSAIQVPSTNEARFVLSTGTVLVYDFLYGQWSTFTGLSAVDACVWGGVVQTVTSAGVVSYENPSVFTDNGTAIELRVTTGWLGAGDLQSFLRIYKLLVLAGWKSSHTLNVWIQYDYRTDTATANKYAIPATVDPSPARFQYRVNLAVQKAEAVSITVFDSATSGESFDLSALSFEVGVKGGPMRLAAGANV